MRKLIFCLVLFIGNCDLLQWSIISNELILEYNDKERIKYSKLDTSFNVIDANKCLDRNSPWISDFEVRCKRWTLSYDEIKYLILNSRPLNGTQMHYDFLILPCFIKGNLYYPKTNDTLSYSLNAGGVIHIGQGKDVVVLGNYKDDQYLITSGEE